MQADWLGTPPSSWKLKPFHAVMHERVHLNHGMKETKVLSLSYGHLVERDVESNYGLLPESFEGYNIVEPNDIVMRLTDLQNDQRSLRTGRVEQRGIITSAYVTVTPSDDYDPRFAHYLLHGYDLAKVFYRMGGGLRQTMKYADLKRMPMVIPPKSEQERIANFLDEQTARIDALIAEKETLLERLVEYRKACITQAITKGLNPAGVSLIPSGIEWLGGIPSHWSMMKLKHLGEAVIGLTYAPSDIVDEGKGTLVLRSSNVQDGRLDYGDNVYVSCDIPQHLRTRVGDILICSRNGSRALIGKNAVIDEQAAGVTFGAFMTIFRSPDNNYLRWVLNSHLFDFHSTSFLTSTINQLTTSNLYSLEVPFPPSEERAEINAHLDALNGRVVSILSHVGVHISRLREYRSSLISAAVTGQLDINTFQARAA